MGMDRASILLVDDEPANIQLLYDVLKQDFRLYFATNGPEALERVSDKQPELILLDVMMPDMDGYQVCRHLKDDSENRDIPVIFVTAMRGVHDEAYGLDLGAVDYITKPINPPIVLARARTHIELKRQRDVLSNIANRDGLTGIANRYRLDETLTREWHRCMRNQAPLSLIMIDVDWFKEFNDAYGHLAGDDCLKRIAVTLAGSLNRPADLIARYGGEEFTCVLPDTDLEGGKHMGEAMRKAIESLRIPHEASPRGHITVSVGVASAIPAQPKTLAELMELADTCLYRAKQSGRNRSLWDALEPPSA